MGMQKRGISFWLWEREPAKVVPSYEKWQMRSIASQLLLLLLMEDEKRKMNAVFSLVLMAAALTKMTKENDQGAVMPLPPFLPF